MSVDGFNFDTTYTSLPQCFYTKLAPAPVSSPEVIVINQDLSQSMGLDFSAAEEHELAAIFSGNQLPNTTETFAQAYAGHQFGHFTTLGDGRALMWGEHITPDNTRVDIQFKGSGRTPYSRRGDGRAALGPMLREYLISEAMHSLGIPTTRSLAVVTTGEQVQRETLLPGAILTRVASSHLRVGTFEFAAAQDDKTAIDVLMNYTIKRHYPELMDADNKAIALINAIMEKQADLVVNWMRVGFIHGVMNTDNMALSGETIDYGPCAFMDNYDANTVFSSIDHTGRYAYANQPSIAHWNIATLAETLLPLIDKEMHESIAKAEDIINQFPTRFKRKWLTMMRAKLGLFELQDDDEPLISELLIWMQNNHADYTNTFRDLCAAKMPSAKLYQQAEFSAWYQRWQNRLKQNAQSIEASQSLMKKTNPVVIPRNHIVEDILSAAEAGDFTTFHEAIDIFKKPYTDDSQSKPYQMPPKPSERVYQTFCGT